MIGVSVVSKIHVVTCALFPEQQVAKFGFRPAEIVISIKKNKKIIYSLENLITSNHRFLLFRKIERKKKFIQSPRPPPGPSLIYKYQPPKSSSPQQ